MALDGQILYCGRWLRLTGVSLCLAVILHYKEFIAEIIIHVTIPLYFSSLYLFSQSYKKQYHLIHDDRRNSASTPYKIFVSSPVPTSAHEKQKIRQYMFNNFFNIYTPTDPPRVLLLRLSFTMWVTYLIYGEQLESFTFSFILALSFFSQFLRHFFNSVLTTVSCYITGAADR